MIQKKETSPSAQKFNPSRFFVDHWGWINIIAVIIIFAAGYFLLLKPQYDNMNAQAETIALNNQFVDLSRSIIKINLMNEAFAGISSEDRKIVTYMLPDEENIENLFPLIETLVAKNGLITASLKIDKVKEGEIFEETPEPGADPVQAGKAGAGEDNLPSEIKKLKILLTVGGADYASLKNLLKSFENSLRLMDVVKIGYDGSDDTSLEILTYYMQN